jgi:hypothetical protein
MALMQGIRSGIEASNKILIMVTEENSEKATAMNRYHACGFGAGLLAGAVIGGAIAFLYAPKTGKWRVQSRMQRPRSAGRDRMQSMY